MAFNLKEYILFRTEIKRELFNEEVDTNFQMVSNPWVATRRYEKGNIVYHPVTLEKTTDDISTTGEDKEYLTWWRANKRTTLGVFNLTQWDIIGGVGGFTDITIAGAKGYGKLLANWQYPAGQVWDTNFDGLVEAVGPTDTIKFAAGAGISLAWNDTDEAILISNTGNLGEVNHGDNIGTASAQSVYDGMTGGYPQNDIRLKGFRSTNVGNPALTVSTVVTSADKDIVYDFDEGQITLANISNGCPELNELCDVAYVGLAKGDILYWSGTTWQNQPASAGMGNTIYTANDTINNSTRTVSLNNSAGNLSFRSLTNPNYGLFIDNGGDKFVLGENATGASGEQFRFNSSVENTGLDYQMSLRNSNTGSSAMYFKSSGAPGGFIQGINQTNDGANYTIAPGSGFNGTGSGDAFTVDQNRDIWVYEWSGAQFGITDVHNENMIPMANAKGSVPPLQTGKTRVSGGLIYVDDSTNGSGSGSNGNILLVNTRVTDLAGNGVVEKPGLFVANAPNLDQEKFYGIKSKTTGVANGTNPAQVIYGIQAETYDRTATPVKAVEASIGQISYEGTNAASATQPVTMGSLIKVYDTPTNLANGAGVVAWNHAAHEIDFGFISVNAASSGGGRNVGIYSDVVNQYSSIVDVMAGNTEFPFPENDWAGLFVGCVAIKKGGLYIEPQSTNPLCGGYQNVLWVNETNNHIYYGDVDLTEGGGGSTGGGGIGCAEEGLSVDPVSGCIEWGELVGGTGAPLLTDREIEFGDFSMNFKSASGASWDFWLGGKQNGSGTGPLLNPDNISSLFHIDNNSQGYSVNEMNATGLLMSGDKLIIDPGAENERTVSVPSVLGWHAKFNADATHTPTYYTKDIKDSLISDISSCDILGRQRYDGYLFTKGNTVDPDIKGISSLYTGNTVNGQPGGGEGGIVNLFGRSQTRDGDNLNGIFDGLFKPNKRPVGMFVQFTWKINNISEGEDWYKWVVDNMATDGTVYGCDPQWDTYMIVDDTDYRSWWQQFEACLDEKSAELAKEIDGLKQQVAETEEQIAINGCDCSNPVGTICIDLCNQRASLQLTLENRATDLAAIQDGIDKGTKYFQAYQVFQKQSLSKEGVYEGTPNMLTWGDIQIGANLQIPSYILEADGNDIFILGGTDTKITTGWKYDSLNDPITPKGVVEYSSTTHNNAALLIGTEGKDWTESSKNDCEIPTAMLDVKGNASDGETETRYPFVRFRDLPQYPDGDATPPPSNIFADDSGYLWKTESRVRYEDEGSFVMNNPLTINFVGAGVDAKLGGGNELIVSIPGGGSSGEVNTASNVGAGTGLYKQKTAQDLEFYSLTSTDSSVDIDLVTGQDVIDLKTAIYTYTAQGTNDPSLRLSDGTTNQDVQLVGTGGTTVSHAAGVVTIDSATAVTPNWQSVMNVSPSIAVGLTTSVELETTNLIDILSKNDATGATLKWEDSATVNNNYIQTRAKGVKQYTGDIAVAAFPRSYTDLWASQYEWRIDQSAGLNSRLNATGGDIQFDAEFDNGGLIQSSQIKMTAGAGSSTVRGGNNIYVTPTTSHNVEFGTSDSTGDSDAYIEYRTNTAIASKVSVQQLKTVITAPLLEIRSQAATGYTLPTSDGAANQVLRTDGAGTATWVGAFTNLSTNAGSGPTYNLTTGILNIPPAPTGGGGLVPVIKAADYTAAANDLVMVASGTNTGMKIKLPLSPSNGDVVGVKWIEQSTVNDTPAVETDTGVTIDGVDRSTASGVPLPLKSLNTYYEFFAYVNSENVVTWFIK